MRHSELKNTEDLHFSRLRVFSGNPDTVIPDFVDQILTNSSNNRVYRATGTAAGQLVELVPQVEQRVIFDEAFPEPMSQTQLLVRVDQNRIYRANGILPTDWLEIVGADGGGGNGGGSSAISVGNNPPQNAPTALGEQYFDSRNGHLFIAIADGANLIWRNTTPPIVVDGATVSDQSLTSNYQNVFGRFFWAYCDHKPLLNTSVDFDYFGWQDAGDWSNLLNALSLYGDGCYALFYELSDPNNEVPLWVIFTEAFFVDPLTSDMTLISTDRTCFCLVEALLNGKSSKGFYFSRERRLGVNLSFSSSIEL